MMLHVQLQVSSMELILIVIAARLNMGQLIYCMVDTSLSILD